MRIVGSTLLIGAIGCALWSPNLLGQEVQVASDKGVITLSVMAQKPYVSGQKKTPVLSVVCQRKGNKTVHAITFSPESILSEQEYSSFGNTTSLVLQMTIGGQKRPTTWEYHNLKSFQATHSFHSFDYFGETEPQRIELIQALLNAPSVSFAFTPFLTGVPSSSTFDLTGLRTEFDKHPECAIKR